MGRRPAASTRAPAPAPLRALVRPVYVPSFVYAVGAGALAPVQVLLALRLGFHAAGVSAIMTWIGAFAIASSAAAGRIVEALGERRSVVVTTAAGAVGLLVAAASAWSRVDGARWVLVVALTLFDLVDAVWSIARQSLVTDLVPSAFRGRAMNLYGACQRLGRAVGPAVASAVLLVTGPAAVLPLIVLIVGTATALLAGRVPGGRGAEASAPSPEELGEDGTRRPTPAVAAAVRRGTPPGAPDRAPSAAFTRGQVAALGAGVLVLAALRTPKESLLPLWAAQGAHLPDQRVALLMTLASGAELVLFWPAGLALDRLGRGPVVACTMALMGVGTLLVPASASPAWLVVCVVLIGLGDGTGSGIIKTIGSDLAPATGRSVFLGRWQAVASAGSLLAPALASVLIAAASLPVAVAAVGALGVAGAVWMGAWTPRVLPRSLTSERR